MASPSPWHRVLNRASARLAPTASPVFWARQQNRALLNENLQALAREAGVGCVLADLSVLLD